MHPYQGRQQQVYWEVNDPPDPTVAQTEAEFLAELEVLLRWSGLSIQEIEQRAMTYGGFLPLGTVARILQGDTLPTEELLVTLLWAVGCDDEAVGLWLWAREHIAEEAHYNPAPVSALAHAIQERGDQGGWRGLHRRAFPDAAEGDGRHAHRRQQPKVSRSAKGPGVSAWLAGGLTAAVVGVGVAFAVVLTGGSNEATAPPRPGNGQVQSQAPETPPTQETVLTTEFPEPAVTTRPPTTGAPRPTTTTRAPQQPSPTPTEPETLPPRLTGSGNASCSSQEGNWVVSISVTANLANATAGTDPQAQAGQGSSVNSFSLSGSGGTSFSGQTSINLGPDTTPNQGTVQWSATVSVAGTGPVNASGSAGYTCP